jgi:uroporphyrinogen decarboxylase
MTEGFTSLQRVLTSLGHGEPDRVPFFLFPTLHGAKELGLTIREYFSRAEHVAEGQLRLQAKYRHDCVCPFFYAAIEVEAWGGEVVFHPDGPPNSGQPILRRYEDILKLSPPIVRKTPCLTKALEAARMLKARIGDAVPMIGVVISPFSLPVMQMGFDRYLDLIMEREDLFLHLLAINEEFCVDWANAQLEGGATAICFFDPISSSTIVPVDLYRKHGFASAMRTISRIKGPTATHLASGRCLPILEDIVKTGTLAVGVGFEEDLTELKTVCRGKLAIIGNLNGIEMRHWTANHAEMAVKKAIAAAGRGGGFILSDAHGEIPWQTPEDVLLAISNAVRRWGRYPLDWIQ